MNEGKTNEGKTNEIRFPMFYLGSEERKSKKSGNYYVVAKFQKDDEQPEVFGFYVGEESLKQEVGVLKRFEKYDLILTLSAFNNKPEVQLIGIGGVRRHE